MKKIPIIIDTDPGVDDFFAIALACAYKDVIDLRAITTIGGNNSTDVTTRNALNILKLLKRKDVKVAKGAESYLKHAFGKPVAKFHGSNGIGDIDLPSSTNTVSSLSAYDMIYEQAKLCNGDLVLVTVGPETNLALAFNKYPDLKDMIKKIVVMGGTLTTGNVTEYAEANIYHDADAAAVVFSQGIPIDMIGLNVTRNAPLRKTIFDGLNDIDPDIKDVMYRLIEFRNEEAMHDAIALSSLLSDKIIKFEKADITIIDDESEKRGMNVVTYNQNSLSKVAIDINVEEYYHLMKDMIGRYKNL